MIIAILGILLALLIYLPSFWVRRVMLAYNKDIEGLPGTGGELAEHLISRFQLEGVKVEETQAFEDHFVDTDIPKDANEDQKRDCDNKIRVGETVEVRRERVLAGRKGRCQRRGAV